MLRQESLRNRIETSLVTLERCFARPNHANENLEEELLATRVELEKQRREHSHRVEELLSGGRRMEELLLAAVKENRKLEDQRDFGVNVQPFEWSSQILLSEVSVHVFDAAEKADAQLLLEPLLLSIAVSNAIGAMPASVSSRSACGLLELEGTDRMPHWIRVVAQKTLRRSHCLFRLQARADDGEVWWPHAVAGRWCAEVETDVASILMQWFYGVCAQCLRDDLNNTELLFILRENHTLLAERNRATCLIIETGGHHLVVLESSLLGEQQMVYFLSCSWTKSEHLSVVGEWVAAETLNRKVLSISNHSRNPLISIVTNVIRKTPHPTQTFVRVTFHSLYSKRDCIVLHGVECNWDAWAADFQVAIVQLVHESDVSRRSIATIIPRGEVGYNRFAFHCAEWSTLSPQRSATEVEEPCTVTIMVRKAEARALQFPLLSDSAPVSDIQVNIDGHDCLGSSSLWLPLGLRKA
ncbi:Hypothetical protein, putative [Bodo saltans]|uniref:Uncharacterized protein n=1 Tax=Bodo saltans TaxID=75058 RepID=A0A0S4J700_BODSA|nr:Hypothetical protein, putative [Bodo saltans]|eukprot:CUG85681.1 Hypothetical protein, putative [Bodo saltans]